MGFLGLYRLLAKCPPGLNPSFYNRVRPLIINANKTMYKTGWSDDSRPTITMPTPEEIEALRVCGETNPNASSKKGLGRFPESIFLILTRLGLLCLLDRQSVAIALMCYRDAPPAMCFPGTLLIPTLQVPVLPPYIAA